MPQQSAVSNPVKRILAFSIALCCLWASPFAWADSWLDETITPADARHLLARTGFDAAPEAQLAIAGLNRQEAINLILGRFNTKPQMAMPAWTQDTAPLYWTRRDMDNQAQREFDRRHDQELSSLRSWWIDEMLTTTSPQTERMVLFWHDHFATSYNGLNRQSMAMARQNQTFRELGMGEFETLLRAMIRDPALLTYLNNLTNRKRSPNENLARELMELFTLGEGNYDENTVKEAARALTGYGVSQNKNLQARFNEWQHDWDEKTLFGETGTFNGDDLITILLKQPALDRHIATRFWHLLVTDRSPTDAEVAPLAAAFRQSGHRLDALYRTVLESKAFWDDEQRGALIKSPVTLLIGTARTLDTPKRISEQLPKLLKLAGQDLLAPPNVSGWEEGPAWITSGRLLNRYTGLKTLLASARKKAGEKSTPALQDVMATPNMMGESGDAMMSENSMNAMGATEEVMPSSPKLTLKLAGENLEGAPRYQIELVNVDDHSLWLSEPYTLKGGWDTARYGQVTERYQLPWQTIRLPIPEKEYANASKLRVHFVNDAANDAGDRNLYVGALSNGRAFAFPQAGSQVSDCIPDNPADTGDLYCQGYVEIPLDSFKQAQAGASNNSGAGKNNDLRYASKHIGWANHNTSNGVLNARIVFQDLRYKGRHWPVFSAWYRVQPNGDPALWLNREECWPDCVQQWPSCAWVNDKAPKSLTIAFTALGARNDENRQCQIDALQDDEAAVVDGLLVHAVDVLSDTLADDKERFPSNRSNIKESLMMIIQRLENGDIVQAFKQATPTGRTELEQVPRVVHDVSAKRPYPETNDGRPLPIKAASLDARQNQIYAQGFSWATALAPGIDVVKLPGWSEHDAEKKSGATLYKSIEKMLLNPAYQVY